MCPGCTRESLATVTTGSGEAPNNPRLPGNCLKLTPGLEPGTPSLRGGRYVVARGQMGQPSGFERHPVPRHTP